MSIAIIYPSSDLTDNEYAGYYLTFPFDYSVTGDAVSDNPTISTELRRTTEAFKRVIIRYLYRGSASISWELERNFFDPLPHTFQLQGSNSGTPRGDDWIDIGSPVTDAYITDTQTAGLRMHGKTSTFYYRVKLTTIHGVYYSMIASVLGTLNKHDWIIVQEILRKEELAHKIFSSVPGYLLKGRRFGPKCTHALDDLTDDIIDSDCSDCYGTGFLSGFYPPTSYYALLDPEVARESRDLSRGTIKPVVLNARMIATLPLVQGDVWINIGSDERYYVHTVSEKASWKSVPIVYGIELRLAPFTDAIYTLSLD